MSKIFAWPVLPRTKESVFEHLRLEKERIKGLLEMELDRAGINGLVIESPVYATVPWLKIACWVPSSASDELTYRTETIFHFEGREFYRFPVELTIETQIGERKRKIPRVIHFSATHAEVVVIAMTRPGKRLHKGNFKRCRPKSGASILDIFLPKNRLVSVKFQWLATLRVYWIAWLALFLTGGCFLAQSEQGDSFSLVLFGAVIVMVILRLIIPTVWHQKGRRPMQEPRDMIRYDSWQTVVTGIGASAEALQESVRQDLLDGRHSDAFIEKEQIWHWGLDGKVERQQIVVRFRRSLVFIEIHPYGDDLYVDWEAYINRGAWKETTVGCGFTRGTNHVTVVHGIEPWAQALGEFDLSDANFALEWVHAVVRRHLKRLLAEHKIDEEIDFRIIRESRDQVRQGGSEKKGRFRRTVGASE